jgi:hypothetical protein
MNDHPIIITTHARQRYVERAVDPQKYGHLGKCGGCETCDTLIREIDTTLLTIGRQIDRRICRRVMDAIRGGEKVTNPLFLEALRKRMPKEAVEDTVYYIDRSREEPIIFAVRKRDEKTNVLLTVMSYDMIEGTILRACNTHEDATKVLKRWKFQSKQGV